MNKPPRFNYIIPIHNKEDILAETLAGVAACCGRNSRIYPVLDGCTDRSEEIVDVFTARTNLDVRKLYMPDVHMLRSVNAALEQIEDGFTIVLQDDVIIQEPNLETKLCSLYAEFGPSLGVVSLRLAANVRRASYLSQIRRFSMQPLIEEVDFIQSPDDHQQKVPRMKYGNFYTRMVAINGPNCIPEYVRNTIGLLDDSLAPFGYDDDDYCLRSLKAGFVNGLFPLKWRSDIDWGGTRRDPEFVKRSKEIHLRNRKYIWAKHGDFIEEYWRSGCANREVIEAWPQNA